MISKSLRGWGESVLLPAIKEIRCIELLWRSEIRILEGIRLVSSKRVSQPIALDGQRSDDKCRGGD
jgi:hypothetical protein